MATHNWKDIAELIGIGAIVASLVFVGMELQQSRDIAMSEIRAANRAVEVAVNDAFRDHAEIWARGNSEEKLNPADQEIFNLLVRDENDKYFHLVEYFKQMDIDETVHDQVIAQFAAFLYEHPKARKVWAERQNRLQRYREMIDPNSAISADWFNTVSSAITLIEEGSKR